MVALQRNSAQVGGGIPHNYVAGVGEWGKQMTSALILVVIRCPWISVRKVFSSYSKLTCVQFLYKKRFSVVLYNVITGLVKHVYWIEFYVC